MTDVFIRILNLSLSAGWIVLAILLLRLVLKKIPRWIFPVLWAVVGIRLVFPFSVESVLSLIPSGEVVDPQIVYAPRPVIDSGIPVLNNTINPVITQNLAPQVGASVNPLQILVTVAGWVWLIGVALMVLYTGFTYFRLYRKLRQAVRLRNNVYESERVSSPFVLGLLRPRIYLPLRMPDAVAQHVIAHENAHIERKDHWIKPIGFLILSVYWFNPVLWLGYVFLCRDIEMACDERVVKDYDRQQRADYSVALLCCSISSRSIAACPLAFGEVGVKKRVKNVLNYKKPAFWLAVIAVVVCAVLAVCFLTDPVRQETTEDGPGTTQTQPSENVEAAVSTGELPVSLGEKYADIEWDPDYPYSMIDYDGPCELTVLDQVKNDWENLVYEYYQCTALADFDGLRQIWWDDRICQGEIDIAQMDYEAGRYISSYTIHNLYALGAEQLKYINVYYLEELKSFLEEEQPWEYGIVCADVSWVSNEKRLEAGPQFPDGRYNRFFLIGKTEDGSLMLYHIYWDDFLLAYGNMVGSRQEKLYLDYMERMLEDTHEAQKEYVYFHTQELYDLAFQSKSELYSYEIRGWRQLSDKLWAVYGTIYSSYEPEGYAYVNFVGEIDGKYRVIPGVLGLPEELKEGVNLSMFDVYGG